MLLFSFIPIIVVALIFVWYLRLSARWTLGIALNRKLAWLYVVIVFLVTGVTRGVLSNSEVVMNPALATVSGVLLHLAFGSAYFAKFAVDDKRQSPGLMGAMKMTALTITMLGVTSAVLMIGAKLILDRMA